MFADLEVKPEDYAGQGGQQPKATRHKSGVSEVGKWILSFDRWSGRVVVSLDVGYENDKHWMMETIGMDGTE